MKKIYSLVLGMTIGVTAFCLSATSAYADLSWTCTQYKTTYKPIRGGSSAGDILEATMTTTAADIAYAYAQMIDSNKEISVSYGGNFCYTANITGSISASVSQADKDYITNTILNSTILSNIQTQATNAATNAANAKASADTAATNALNAKTSADTASTNALAAKAAAEKPNVFRVIKGQAFTETMYSEINGTSSGVTATSTAGSGYTTLTGTLNTEGIQKITIGGKDLLFKVAPTPTTGAPATVIFGS